MKRIQIEKIIDDLKKKIVFIIGPRQVGKTWLAKEIGVSFNNVVYLNYDHLEDREIIKSESWLESTELLILDELHKMYNWKNYLKGVYDTKSDKLKIIVTGSARLDTFRQAGDSLAGRFFKHRLLPFSLAELKKEEFKLSIDRLIERGGFPEPLLAEHDSDAQRWRKEYVDGLVRTDILDFENIHDFKAIQVVFELLRRKAGSPISYTSIAEDVGISVTTVIKYIQIFEALFIVFRVTPYSNNIARSLLKEAKIYFYDNGLVIGDDGVKFENFVALSLLKHVYGMNDNEGTSMELKYLRTKEGKEVDFAIISNGGISKAIEVKLRDKQIDNNLKYFVEKYGFQGVQVVKELKNERKLGDIEVWRADNFLKSLYI